MGRVSGSAGVGGLLRKGPVDFRTETLSVLKTIGDAVPAGIELGYHLCYGSPADEHCVQPKDMAVMVEIANATSAGITRPIQFFHMPVPKGRTDDAYFVPLDSLRLHPETKLYLGLVHYDDAAGDAARGAPAPGPVGVEGGASRSGGGRGDPARLPSLLAAHVQAARAIAQG